MIDPIRFGLFLSAAFVLAVTPGPGIFYVLTRSIRGGRGEGRASAFGTAVGGLFHVLAAALGLSAILATSAVAFTIVKYLGAVYLIYLGIRTLLRREDDMAITSDAQSNHSQAFYQGITTEILNPKTALFFLAFIPQFINPQGSVIAQFALLGCISVMLNTLVDLVVVALAGPISERLRASLRLRRAQRAFSGGGLIALGLFVALGREQS